MKNENKMRKQSKAVHQTSRQMRSRFLMVRRHAVGLANKCDFCALDSIKRATASCTALSASVVVSYRDLVERAQILTAFTFGTALEGMNLRCHAAEDVYLEKGTRAVCLDISSTEGK